MTAYGFRLFEVSLRRERGRKDVPFHVEKEGKLIWRLTDHLVAALSAQIGSRERGLPHRRDEVEEGDDEAAPTTPPPLFSVLSVGQRGEHLIFTVRYGRRVGQDLAMGDPDDGDEDLDISRHAPSRTYRGCLVVPEGAGKGVFAIEAIGRSSPVQPCVRWFQTYSQRWADSQPKKDGEPGQPWYRLSVLPLGDHERLAHLVNNGDPQKVVLVEHSVTADNKRQARDVELTVRLTPQSKKAVLTRAKTWLDGKVAAKSAAADIAKIIGRGANEYTFDDVTVVLEDDEGQKGVTASALNDVFTYPIAVDEPPDEDRFLGSVRGAVEHLSDTLEGTYSWVDWPEGYS